MIVQPAHIRILLSLALMASLLGCTLGLHRDTVLTPGEHTFLLRVGGRQRTYLVYAPAQVKTGAPLPVVLDFHGGGGNAENQRAYSDMDTTADRHGFIAVYPNGTGGLRDKLLTWNAGHCCGYAMEHDVDDVAFVAALLDDLARRTPVDATRVYATGLSNGAMMSYYLAGRLPDRIAAIAPVAGVPMPDILNPTLTMPILHFHSVDDPRALYEGGLGPPFPLTDHRVEHAPVEEVLALWIAHNGCPETPVVSDPIVGEAGTENENQTATKIVYGPCEDGTEVALWKFTGVGHVWPGGDRTYLEGILGSGTRLVDANEAMWEFFTRFTRE